MMHLAELLEEEMCEREWSMYDLVMNMGPHWSKREWDVCQLSWELFMNVRKPNVLLGEAMAEQLSVAFGINHKFFLNFHEAWRSAELAKVKA